MNDELKQTIKNEVGKLPKEVQEVIDNFDWLKISDEIGKKNLLDDKEVDILQNEVGLVLTGAKNQDLFALNIENNVGTSKIEAMKITTEVNQQIFKPMLEKLELLIKDNLANKKLDWDQTINFIISGGDYSVFIDGTENMSNKKVEKVAYREVI